MFASTTTSQYACLRPRKFLSLLFRSFHAALHPESTQSPRLAFRQLHHSAPLPSIRGRKQSEQRIRLGGRKNHGKAMGIGVRKCSIRFGLRRWEAERMSLECATGPESRRDAQE